MNKDKKIYTIATAHLDTVWNWDFEHVIKVCIPATLDDNFKHFEQYPEYRFNFEGSYRYELMEEYYPEKFEQLRKYIEEGRWNVTGSSFENGDVNVPSPEALFRNILYGNRYFEKKFGKKSNDIFLPDCFGFGWALPSIIEHAGIKGFSTQKLSWGSAYGIPFDIGRWYGVNGKCALASVNAKSYCTTFKKVRTNSGLIKKLDENVKKYDLPVTYAYHGVGDVGGAPKEPSVKTVCEELRKNDSSEIKVLSSSPTEFFDDISSLSQAEIEKLPKWENELLMTDHGVGSYISRAFSKRMNRRNEEIADMAERMSVAAEALVGAEYPRTEIDLGWKRTLAHTFHDDITGTSVERVYQRSWNDYVLSANQLSNAYEGAASEIIKKMDTSWTKGTPIVINNTVEHGRMGEVDLVIDAGSTEYVRVYDKNGKEVPSQVNYIRDGKMCISVADYIPALGFKVLDVVESDSPCKINTGLRCSGRSIENFKYIVTVNSDGDISSIIDKTLDDTELLKKPIRFELNKYKGAGEYAAWELRYKEVCKYPWEFAGKGKCTLIEKGPVRVTLKVVQTVNKSTFTYYVSLVAGCPYVTVRNEVEWREFCRTLHNGFYFNAGNKKATFDLGLGAIKREKANKKLYSVPAQRWADITDKSGVYGVSVFSDSKYGWIMKDEKSLRLTVVHSPKQYYRHDSVQGMMDFGLNRYGYAIYSHKGEYDNGTQLYARFFNQPLTVFVTNNHEGVLSSEYSFGGINDKDVIVRAIKKAEADDCIIVRFNEGANKKVRGVEFTLGKGIATAKAVNGMEENIGPATVVDGKLVFDLDPYEVKSFAITLVDSRVGNRSDCSKVELPYNIDVVTFNHNRAATAIPTINVSIPGELVPKTIQCAGIKFETGDIWGDGNNALICAGQKINVYGKKLYFIGASLYGDKVYEFKVGDEAVPVKVQSIDERIGKWDLYNLAEVANIKTDKLAIEYTHTHLPQGDNVAAQIYFFMYELDVSGGSTVTLPEDNGLIILAAAQSNDGNFAKLESALYDRVSDRRFDYQMSRKEKKHHKKQMKKWKKTPNKS